MVCTCDVEGVRETEARRIRIFQRMKLDNMKDLTTAILLSLAFDFQGEASNIYADQWFAVSFQSPLMSLDVECDWPADGFAVIWEHMAEQFPERVSVKLGGLESMARICLRISAVLLSQYEEAMARYTSHREVHKDNPHDSYKCEDCSVFMSLSIIACQSLMDEWGFDALKDATEKAFS